MLFYKNILKKKNIISYLITLFIMAFIIIAFIFFDEYLENKKNSIINSELSRTITILGQIDCNIKEKLDKCFYDADKTILVVNNVNDIERVASQFQDDYQIILTNIDNSDIIKIIDMINILSILSQISFFLINAIMIYIFINDDKKMINILRCIGFSKNYLFINMCGCYAFIISIISIMSFVLISLFYCIFLGQTFIIQPLIRFLIDYGIFLSEVLIIYYLFFLVLNKRRVR